jgi:thioredoxin 1
MENRLMGSIREITDSDFEAEVLNSDQPVLVDFWAPWCAPCRMIAPLLEQLAADNAGSIKVVKVDVAEHQENAGKYQVFNIPTLILFKNGEMIDRFEGLSVATKGRLEEAIQQAVG